MKITKSPLELLQFSVLKLDYSFEPQNAEKSNFNETTEEYMLDLDYEIRTGEDEVYLIFTKVVINGSESKLPGHSIYLEAVNVFQLNNEDIDIETKKSLINFSAVTIAFANARNYIADITACTPAGKYLFPIFDLQSLVKLKIEQSNRHQKRKKAAISKKKAAKPKA